ncbi:hypothetical protein SAMN05216516_101644 [Izhakiella capsodis]|uniref:Uncharacterized protein n=1 Tax=Izhakiella capsodis TaxID=1367852 RepID=A0A1I4VAD5_9GAMM|nr:hypothetical protein [Izhakiella capsodis]SFM98134.1 hypothetical protein SAMN05216516_101644 [Izhakiella capsodis]
MHMRLMLAGIPATILLFGCTPKPAVDDASEAFSGPTRVHITHLLTRADDGSRIFLTVDGKEVGILPAGESRDINLKAGKHQIGGYVSTLFNYGRVTVKPVDIITNTHAVQDVTYAVTSNQYGFTITGSTPVPSPAPAVKPAPANSNQNLSADGDTPQATTSITPPLNSAQTTPGNTTAADINQSPAAVTPVPAYTPSATTEQPPTAVVTTPGAAEITNTPGMGSNTANSMTSAPGTSSDNSESATPQTAESAHSAQATVPEPDTATTSSSSLNSH